MYNILICDDEADIVSALKIYLSDPSYHILTANDGEQAVALSRTRNIHLIIMDIMMPRLDGISAMTEIRKTSNVPIILLTAKSEDADVILGLNVGADDYITKPFKPMEVVARVKSQLRRYISLGGGGGDVELSVGGLSLDDSSKAVSLDGQEISLTPTEYEILKLLMSRPGRVFSPSEIYLQVWHDEPYDCENTVAVHVRHIREKIEIDPSKPRYLLVVWGQGYVIKENKRK